MPYEHLPQYLLAYMVEELECGHKITVYPHADLLIAKRRNCTQCSEQPKKAEHPKKSNVLPFRKSA